MKTIELDDDLYFYIASQTRHIGESASDILRRLLEQPAHQRVPVAEPVAVAQPSNGSHPTRAASLARFW